MRLTSQLLSPAELTPIQRRRMHRLMRMHYAGVTRRSFDRDLAEKRWVLLLSDARGQVQGFTTLMLLEVEVAGERVQALFSGDTIIHRAYWGEPTLAQAWAAFALDLAERTPGPLYWFLISKGYRTYKYLPLYFEDYHPRPDAAPPPRLAAIMAALAERKYPGSYDARRGLIRVPGKDRLRPELAAIEPHRLNDPHVRFFLERNPGYAAGDELVCLAELSRRNFRPHVLRRRLSPGA